jgi:hypothetical protein
MKLRYLFLASLVGGLVSFAWGFVSHGTGLLPALEPHAFSDSTAVVEAVTAQAPVNGVYFDRRGLFAAVSFNREATPRYASLVVPMATQLLIEVAVAFLLAWVLLRLPVWSVLGTGSLFAAVGLAAGLEQLLPEAIWYGFPLPFQLANLADLVVGWFLLGGVIGAFRRRLMTTA